MPARKCPKCGRPMKGKCCASCEAATHIAKPEHAKQAKVAPPGDDSAIQAGEPRATSKPLEPLPNRHGPSPGLVVLGFGCFMWSMVVGISIVTVVSLVLPACQYVRNAAVRTETINHMKEIGFACHWYHDFHKELPPPKYTTNK